MRSHPLLVEMGKGVLPSPGAPAQARMLTLGEGYRELAEAEAGGSPIFKAADWRWAPESPENQTVVLPSLPSA